MRRTALLSATAWLISCSFGFGQELPEPDGITVSQLPDKKSDPLQKPPVKVDTPPQIAAAEPTPAGSRLQTEFRVSRAPEMVGDIPPSGRFTFVQGPPERGAQGIVVPGPPVPIGLLPGTGGFKAADNASPRPQDRFFFSFNFYDNLYDPQNRELGSDVHNVRLYRETFGVEKSFFDRRVSVGLRLPINTLTLRTDVPDLGGTHTAVGDLTITMMAAILRNEEAGNYLTLGLGITPPTGPSTLANLPVIPGPRTTILQPLIGVLGDAGAFYVQGFTAFDFPTGTNQLALWYNDVSVGVFVLRAEERQFITAIAPAFEVHSAVALNASNNFGPDNPNAFANVVNLGFIGNMEFLGRSRLALGVVFPVSSPRPFDAELIAQFRFVF